MPEIERAAATDITDRLPPPNGADPIMLQTMMLTILFCFGIMAGRQGTSFIPCRDHAHFAGSFTTMFPRKSVHGMGPLEAREFATDSNGN